MMAEIELILLWYKNRFLPSGEISHFVCTSLYDLKTRSFRYMVLSKMPDSRPISKTDFGLWIVE